MAVWSKKEQKPRTKKQSKQEQKLKQSQHKAVQNLLAFNRIYEDGTVELADASTSSKNRGRGGRTLKRYARIIKFSDINYQIASQDEQVEIFAKYSELITFFDPAVMVQILILNKEVDKTDVLKTVLLRPRGDTNDKYREDYNDVLMNNLFVNKTTFQREKYIVFSYPAENYEAARSVLDRLVNYIKGSLSNLNAYPELLDNEVEVLALMHSILRPHEEFNYDKKDIMHRQKDVIAPMGAKLGASKIELYTGDVDPMYMSVLVMRDYPPTIMDTLVSELSMQQFNTVTSIFFRSIEQAEAIKMVQKKLTAMNTEVYEIQRKNPGLGDVVVPFNLKQNIMEAETLLEDLRTKGQRLFLVTVAVAVFGKNAEDLKNNIAEIKGIARKNGANFDVVPFFPAESLNSILPLGRNFLPVETVERLLNTSATAILIPFTSMDFLETGGFYYGINAITQVPIIINRLESTKDPNGFILGTPGSGKSFMAKKEITSVVLGTNDEVLVIDPEREYKSLCEALGGTDIVISPATNTFLNPLDMAEGYEAGEGDPVTLKSGFLQSLISTMFGGDLSGKKKSIIDRTLRVVYQKKELERVQQNGRREDYYPTLLDFYNELKNSMRGLPPTSEEYREASDILLTLELYTTGSFSLFAKPTNVNINNRFVVFDIKDLSSEIKTLGMLVVLDQIWNRMAMNREKNKRTWIYIDEIYLLFQNEYSENFLFTLFKRSRKWGGIITGITQNVEDLLRSDLARTMLANSTEFLILFNQAPSDRDLLKNVLKLSDQEMRYISGSSAGQGLLGINHRWIPFYDKFPQTSEIYKLITTKVGET